MRVPLRFLLVAGAATALLVVGGVLLLGGYDRDDPVPTQEPFRTTPLAEVDTTTTAVTRGPFCDRVDDRQVASALGLEPGAAVPDAVAWANGDELDLGSGRPDVVHEFGCAYAVQDGGEARAWVFAPPVDATRAARLVRSATRAAGCTPGAGPAFGAPTLALTCADDAGTVRASYRGLFGDAWLVCEVAVPATAAPFAAEVVDRAGRWCTGVLEATGPR